LKLKDKAVIITGASKGLGMEIAKFQIMEGANISICSREKHDLEKILIEFESIRNKDQKIFAYEADISKETDVSDFVDFSINNLERVDVLINNAGIYGPKGNVDIVDINAWIQTININLLGTLLMCKKVIPEFKKNGKGKIINLSGGGATSPLPGLSAYAATKAAVVRLTETLSLELKKNNIFVNAIAPGALNTRLLDEVIQEGKGKVPTEFYEKCLKQKETGGTPLTMGAELCVYLASDESDGITGKLISAVWDDWKNLHKHLKELDSDLYTLRRIIPEDRGITLNLPENNH
jgi:NAD(P)-dependent dehydrogenase (short-subunit alcohol dehydrogenase family)